jgi:hypothetical protein
LLNLEEKQGHICYVAALERRDQATTQNTAPGTYHPARCILIWHCYLFAPTTLTLAGRVSTEALPGSGALGIAVARAIPVHLAEDGSAPLAWTVSLRVAAVIASLPATLAVLAIAAVHLATFTRHTAADVANAIAILVDERITAIAIVDPIAILIDKAIGEATAQTLARAIQVAHAVRVILRPLGQCHAGQHRRQYNNDAQNTQNSQRLHAIILLYTVSFICLVLEAGPCQPESSIARKCEHTLKTK